MLEKRIRHLAVGDGEEILGIITTRDLINTMRIRMKQDMKLDYDILEVMTMADIPLRKVDFLFH